MVSTLDSMCSRILLHPIFVLPPLSHLVISLFVMSITQVSVPNDILGHMSSSVEPSKVLRYAHSAFSSHRVPGSHRQMVTPLWTCEVGAERRRRQGARFRPQEAPKGRVGTRRGHDDVTTWQHASHSRQRPAAAALRPSRTPKPTYADATPSCLCFVVRCNCSA